NCRANLDKNTSTCWAWQKDDVNIETAVEVALGRVCCGLAFSGGQPSWCLGVTPGQFGAVVGGGDPTAEGRSDRSVGGRSGAAENGGPVAAARASTPDPLHWSRCATGRLPMSWYTSRAGDSPTSARLYNL